MMSAAVATHVASGHYVHWGVVQISLTNLLVIVGMVVLFIVALVAPFPGSHETDDARTGKDSGDDQN